MYQVPCVLLAAMSEAVLERSAISYSAAVSAFEKAGEWQTTLVLLATMHKTVLRPNAISYNAAMSACEKGAAWQSALLLLAAMPAHGFFEPGVISVPLLILISRLRQ